MWVCTCWMDGRWPPSSAGAKTSPVKLFVIFLHRRLTFGACFSSDAGTVCGFSMRGFIQQETDNEHYCFPTATVPCFIRRATLNAALSVSVVKKQGTIFEFVRLHLALISIKLQCLNPLRPSGGGSHRHNWETSFKSWGFIGTNTACDRWNEAWIRLSVFYKERRFAKTILPNIKVDVTFSPFHREEQKGTTLYNKSQAFSAWGFFVLSLGVKRGFVSFEIFHCRKGWQWSTWGPCRKKGHSQGR